MRLNVVCFTLDRDPTAERVTEVLDAVTASGEAFLTPTVYKGQRAVRAASSNRRHTSADTDRVHDAIVKALHRTR